MDGLESLGGTKVGNIKPQVGHVVIPDGPGAIVLASGNADRFDSFLTSVVFLTQVCRAKFSFADVVGHGRGSGRLKGNLNTRL